MAVNKELLERYKALKAQGINVSLAELKAEMEGNSSNNTSSASDNSSSYVQHQTIAQQNTYDQVSSYNTVEQPTINKVVEQPTYQTTYSSLQSNKPNPIPTRTDEYSENYQNNFNVTFSNNLTSNTIESYSNSQNQQPYTGNLHNLELLNRDTSNKYTGNVTEELIEKFNQMQTNTKKYALIGYPLGHSLSAYIHEAGFKSLSEEATYEILETSPENLVERIKYLKSHNYSGFNVTIPLKLPITMFLNDADESAKIVNAVNTVVIDTTTKELKGYNTDVIGFRNAIPNDVIIEGKIAGVLGTGGAARAAITALAMSNIKEIKLYTRNIPNCLELLNYLRKTFPNVEFNSYQIERIRDLSNIDILVNTTPIGMQGRAADMTPIEGNELKTLPAGAIVYDVIYNPKKTVFLKLAQKLGYRTINGIDMFIHQALAAEQIWTGKTPDFKDMKIAALENL